MKAVKLQECELLFDRMIKVIEKEHGISSGMANTIRGLKLKS